MKHITFALLAASVVLSGCIVAAPTPQVIVVTATSAPAQTAAPTATVRVVTPSFRYASPGAGWERFPGGDTCDASNPCEGWAKRGMALQVYSDGSVFISSTMDDFDAASFVLAFRLVGVPGWVIDGIANRMAAFTSGPITKGGWMYGFEYDSASDLLTIGAMKSGDTIGGGPSTGSTQG